VLLTNPTDVFPFAVGTSRTCDLDHPDPYRHPDPGGGGTDHGDDGDGGDRGGGGGGDRGGGAGAGTRQTHPGNAAPLHRFHHRIKTHAKGWSLRQPEPGSYLWRSPHGYYWLTGHTGTHPLTTHIGQHLWDTLDNHDTRTDQATG
jgi:hypothetical protein